MEVFDIMVGDDIRCVNGSHGVVESFDNCTRCIRLVDGDNHFKMNVMSVRYINEIVVEPSIDTIKFVEDGLKKTG